jgi:hypothetical protein
LSPMLLKLFCCKVVIFDINFSLSLITLLADKE